MCPMKYELTFSHDRGGRIVKTTHTHKSRELAEKYAARVMAVLAKAKEKVTYEIKETK